MVNAPKLDGAAPWGRFLLVSKDIAEESDHIYFRDKVTTIGRNKRRCDLVIDKLFISSVHCVVKLDDTDNNKEPSVELHDNSRNGIWVNADRVGKGASVTLGKGYTIHFTKPGTTPAGVTPMVYKFELLNNFCSSRLVPLPKEESRVQVDMIDMTIVADEALEATQQATPTDVPLPLNKKRKREGEASAHATIAAHDLKSLAMPAGLQVKATETKLEAAKTHTAAISSELEQNMRVKVDKLAQDNLDLMNKFEAATAMNLQLKTQLVANDNDTAVKIKEAVEKSLEVVQSENKALKEELAAKDEAMELKINEAVKKKAMADQKLKACAFAVKLKEATTKYQQKVEAESFELRRDMSEKMAAYADENEKLQATLSTEEANLISCENQIASLKEKVNGLEGTISNLAEQEKKMEKLQAINGELEEKLKALSATEIQLVTSKQKVTELEERISVMNDENLKLVRLLSVAEHKVIEAENKAAEATIAAAAAKNNSDADVQERHELRNALISLRSELEMYRASRKEELKQQQEATSRASTATATTVTLSNLGTDSIALGEDRKALRARLATALHLFSQVHALGLEGVNLITEAKSTEPKDHHELSVASVESARAVSNSPSAFPLKDAQQQIKECPNDSPRDQEKSAEKIATETDNINVDTDEAAAEPKVSPSTKHEKKRAKKQTAPLSTALKESAALASVAKALTSNSTKDSSSDASTVRVGVGDWEMVE